MNYTSFQAKKHTGKDNTVAVLYYAPSENSSVQCPVSGVHGV